MGITDEQFDASPNTKWAPIDRLTDYDRWLIESFGPELPKPPKRPSLWSRIRRVAGGV